MHILCLHCTAVLMYCVDIKKITNSLDIHMCLINISCSLTEMKTWCLQDWLQVKYGALSKHTTWEGKSWKRNTNQINQHCLGLWNNLNNRTRKNYYRSKREKYTYWFIKSSPIFLPYNLQSKNAVCANIKQNNILPFHIQFQVNPLPW